MSLFKKAEKKKAKLRLGITGPSGSGKTYSALRLASGLGGKIAVIDTERGSATLYADKFNFDVLELLPPYEPKRYVEAMNAAIAEGYEVIVMDSISHAWAGEGGLLNQKEQLDSRGGNSFANWAKMTPIQEKFISAIVGANAHIIVTMRSKQEHIQVVDNGKTKIQKVGLSPIQRDGFEYELTTVFDVGINHEAASSKDRTGMFVDKIFQITEETGKQFKEWLESGVDASNNNPSQSASTVNKTALGKVAFGVVGQYEIKTGKYAGKKLAELDISHIESAIEYLIEEKSKPNGISKDANEFLTKAQTYLELLSVTK